MNTLLAKAAHVLKNNGRGVGSLRDSKDQVCPLGALLVASEQVDALDDEDYNLFNQDPDLQEAVKLLVAEVDPSAIPESYDAIVDWNDEGDGRDPKVSDDEVIQTMMRAARKG